MDDATVLQDAPGDEERLRECYHAFLARRVARGSRSIRTRRGYEHLRANYQPRVRFLLEQAVSDGAEPSSQHAGDSLKELVGPYIDMRVLQFVADVCWPLAHLGPQGKAVRKLIPEWQELPSSRYFAVMVSILLWMFPGLPSFEVQELMERDWQNDRDFDPFGNEGLSLEGFTVSFIDLAVACTNGNVDRCIEFLKLLVDRLESSLAPVHEQFSHNESGKQHDNALPGLSAKQLRWISIPLGQLVPCKARQKPVYYELKAKASTAPMVLMVLASNEKPFEFQLSSSSKLLVRERDSRTSIRRKTIALKTHLIELEKQILWTLRDWTPAHPSVFLIPNTSLSQRAQKLFACLRLLDSHEQELHSGVSDDSDPSSMSPLLTLYSSIQDPVKLEYRAEVSSVGRIERMGSQLFVLDHRGRRESFVVSIKSSLLHNTNAAGGIGAAAIVSTTQFASTRASIGDTDIASALYAKDSAAHTFVFVVKDQREFAAPTSFGVHRQNGVLPQQWFCSMSAADETKTLAIHPQSNSECCSASGLYYLYIFSLHGMYYEVSYQDDDSIIEADEVSNREEVAPGANRNPRSNDAAHTFTECDPSDDEEELAEVTKAASGSSTVLLRCLLKLRQKRKDKTQAEPLPSFLEGTKVEKMKAVSAAVTLRSKFLKAREMARRARVLEQEQAFGDNLKELLMKHNASFKRGAQTPKPSVGDPNPLSEVKLDEKRSVFEDQMQLLASFFREMAVHVPSEADPSTQGIMYRPVDEQLLREFGDLFERDYKLLNMLDEEKWESEEAQKARKAVILQEQLRNRGTAIGQSGGMSIGNENLLHEDYMGTAAYIEELMRAVAEEEDGCKFANITSDDHLDEDKRFQNLQASWAYAQLRTNSAQRRLRHTDQKMEQFEHQRREEWMKSHYVTDLARQARFSRPSSPARAVLTFSKTGFEPQQEELPWNPIWEVHEDTGPGDEQQPISPAKSQERPKRISPAKSGVPIVPHEQRVSRSHGRDETAVRSASLSYARRLRIERVRSAPPTQSPRKVAAHSTSPSQPPYSLPQRVPHTPSLAFSHDAGFLHLEELTSPLNTTPTPEENDLVYTSEACAAEVSLNTKSNEMSSSTSTAEITTAKLHENPRQKRRGIRSKRETPMSQRIKELLSMSETARGISRSPEEDNSDMLFPASSDLPIPARDKPKCWRPR